MTSIKVLQHIGAALTMHVYAFSVQVTIIIHNFSGKLTNDDFSTVLVEANENESHFQRVMYENRDLRSFL